MYALRNSKVGLSTAVAVALFAAPSFAAVEPVVAEVEFIAPVTLTETNPLQFGLIHSTLANAEVVAIDSAGTVTDTLSRVAGGTQAAAAITVGATAAAAMTIIVDNVTNGTGYALSAFVCAYDGGTEAACDGAGLGVTSVASAALTIGATLTGDGAAVVGAQNGSFDVTVAYD